MSENAEPDDQADSVASRLLQLQRIDTEADQLRVKRERLPEREDLATQTAAMVAWEKRRGAVVARIAVLGADIEREESTGADLLAARQRLEAQMKTVIAPREAEALMHEIETINGQRDQLDDEELAALEEQSALDDELSALLGNEESLRTALRRSDEVLGVACADIDRDVEMLATQRVAAVGQLEPTTVARYESVRSALGVAVSELNGTQCTGCHLALSAAEIDDAKDDAAATGYCDCPQCGRMLVV